MSELPHGWVTTTVGHTLKLRYGKALGADQRLAEGRYPVLGSAGEMFRTDAALVHMPSIVIGRKGAIGRSHLMAQGGWSSDTTYYAAIPEALDSRFLLHQMNALRLEQFDSSTATPSLRRQDLERQLLKIPPLNDQRRIIEVLEDHLSRLDAANDYLRAAKRRCMTYSNQVIALELVGEGEVGERAAPSLAPAGTVDGVLQPLPSGWSWNRLEDLASVVGGVTKDSKKQADPSFVDVPYLRVANVQRGRLDLTSISRIRVAPAKLESLRLQPGDVLMNEGGDRDKLARGWVWNGEVKDCIHQNHVFRARATEDRIHPKLLAWAANSLGSEWAARNGKQSVNLASISLTKIKLMPIPVPPMGDQPAIVRRVQERLAVAARAMDAIAEQERRSVALRRALLTAAFSGRLTGRSTDTEVVEEMAGSQEAA